jgi:hypothetical protein
MRGTVRGAYIFFRGRSALTFIATGVFVILSTFSKVEAANITLSPSQGAHTAGKTFSVDILVSNNQDAINGVSATISFDQSLLQLDSISKSGSIVSIWATEPTFSNGEGSASMEGIILNPGYSGTSGKIATLVFRSKNEGTANVTIAAGSVLANDGQGTNVVKTLGSASFTINQASAPDVQPDTSSNTTTPSPSVVTGTAKLNISSKSYPDQKAWYNTTDAAFAWELPYGVTSVRLLADSNPTSVPSKAYTPPISSKEFAITYDGVQYLHVQAKNASGWGPVAHYGFRIDTEAPKNAVISYPQGQSFEGSKVVIQASATDQVSGLGSVEFVIDGISVAKLPASSDNLYSFEMQLPGDHTGYALIADQAGNTAKADVRFKTTGPLAPRITAYTKNPVSGEELEVHGIADKNMLVEITYQNIRNDATYTFTATSAPDGTFDAVIPDGLAAGGYELKARSIIGTIASAYSAPAVVLVDPNTFVSAGLVVLNWLSIAFLLIISIFACLAAVWYLYGWTKRLKRTPATSVATPSPEALKNAESLKHDMQALYAQLEEKAKAQTSDTMVAEAQSKLEEIKKRLEAISTKLGDFS